MSLFEDLVEELKEENLLEETVIESRKINVPAATSVTAEFDGTDAEADDPIAFTYAEDEQVENGFDDRVEVTDSGEDFDLSDLQQVQVESFDEIGPEDPEPESEPEPESSVADVVNQRREEYSRLAQKHDGETGRQYFRRRATEEVKTLQMVDHIVTRVEKEQANINSVPYDDLKVKQALHRFLQLNEEANASEVAEIEFVLLQETESWYTALTLRDKAITVENLRCYCDTAVPSLSKQALLALARFYRNAPYSELVRSKFDLIITKLYTTEDGEGKREISAPKESVEEDVKELYKEWSSIPIYAAEAEDKELEFGAMGFQDFIDEAKRAHSFDELMTKDFFKRLNDFKTRASESFFAPHIVAAAIECNVAVGNRYLELIENEHGGRRPDELSDKYGFLTDSAITEAIKKVFSAHEAEELAKAEAGKKKKKRPAEQIFDVEKLSNASAAMAKRKVEWYKANKKLVVATAVTVLIGIFYFFFSAYLIPSGPQISSGQVQEISLENSEFSNFITSARISKDTAYAITNESWKKLAKPQKEEMMKKLLATGTDKGFSQINFLDSKGKKVGYVSVSRLEITE